MATTYTTNYNLGKQTDHADKFDMSVITDNADKIDTALKENADAISGKVDKETGKGLSTNDYTTAEKTKLDDLVEIKSIGTGLNLDSSTGELTATGGGGGGGTSNYNDLTNKPQINSVTLSGNKSLSDLGITYESETAASGGTALSLVTTGEKYAWNNKQNTISDLSAIRSGAALGSTAVQPEAGKGLSTNDYTTAEKTKLAGIEAQANKTTVDDALNDSSTNPVQNKVVKAALDNKADTADIPTVPITAIQKNGTGITPVSGTVNITVPTTAADVSALPDTTKYATALSLTINSSTFVMTGQLKDQNGDNLGTAQTIDLPLESVVVGGSYNSQTKKVVLTLQNGNTIEFSVADLVSGLQTELSASNKLNPAYINYDSTHRAVSDTEKSTWNGKQNALSSAQLDAVNSGITSAKVTAFEGKQDAITSSNKLSADLVDDSTATHKFATAAQLSQIETNKNNISLLHDLIVPSGSILNYVDSLDVGFYTARQGSSVGTDKPLSNGAFAYLIFVFSAGTAQITAFEAVVSGAAASPDIFTILKNGGTWGAWRKFEGTAVT